MAEIIDFKNPRVIEDVVIGCLRQMRDFDEDVIRLRWRGHASDTPMDKRVINILGNNGPEFHVIMNTLKAAGCVDS
jgi:hypothetical protein